MFLIFELKELNELVSRDALTYSHTQRCMSKKVRFGYKNGHFAAENIAESYLLASKLTRPRVSLDKQRITGYFVEKCFHTIDCSSSDNKAHQQTEDAHKNIHTHTHKRNQIQTDRLWLKQELSA